MVGVGVAVDVVGSEVVEGEGTVVSEGEGEGRGHLRKGRAPATTHND